MAEAGDVANLARKLRAGGADDAQVVEGLKGLGYSSREAAAAARATAPASAPTPETAPPAKAKPKTPRGGSSTPGPPADQPPASQPATPGAAGVPQLSMPSLPSLTLTPPKRLNGGDIGGFVGGLLAYVLLLNYIRYGPDGVKGWLRAKFLNQPDESMTLGLTREPRIPTTEQSQPSGGRPRGDQPGVGIALNLNRAVLPGDFTNGDQP